MQDHHTGHTYTDSVYAYTHTLLQNLEYTSNVPEQQC